MSYQREHYQRSRYNYNNYSSAGTQRASRAPRSRVPRNRISKKVLVVVAILVVAAVIWLQAPWKNFGFPQPLEPFAGQAAGQTAGHTTGQPAEQAAGQAATSGQPTLQTQAPLDTSFFTAVINTADVTDTQFLALVNRDHAINTLADPDLVNAIDTVPILNSSVFLHPKTFAATESLLQAAQVANITNLCVSSGWRSYEAQERLYAEATDKSLVQKPNHSEHQTGLAADIVVAHLTQKEMARSHEAKWLAENSWKYGLVVRYAKDKKDITHIASEPWHFRYVGKLHAWYCWSNNLCLEEYLELLQETGGYHATFEGTSYTVVYEEPENGKLRVPPGTNYIVSSDNMGGYIVSSWE
ncbi:MAG: M15 family metallopeptidase [Coriobacteriia bacterium]|nr:M15 family metallopeptidase [Coriobacteriia bacterium]